MLAVFIILYGAWITGTGYHSNSANALTFIGQQKGYISWIIAVFILYLLYQVQAIQPVVKPFIALALLALVLKNWSTISSQLNGTFQEFGI